MVFGAIMFVVMTKISKQSLDAVAKGGTLAEEVVGSIRTVQAFGTARVLGDKYKEFVARSGKIQAKGSPVEGGGLAIMCKPAVQRPYRVFWLMISFRHIRSLCPCLLLRWYTRLPGPSRLWYRHQRVLLRRHRFLLPRHVGPRSSSHQ